MAENIQGTTNGDIKLATIDADENPILGEKLQGKIFDMHFKIYLCWLLGRWKDMNDLIKASI